jgi:hypothetical protein
MLNSTDCPCYRQCPLIDYERDVWGAGSPDSFGTNPSVRSLFVRFKLWISGTDGKNANRLRHKHFVSALANSLWIDGVYSETYNAVFGRVFAAGQELAGRERLHNPYSHWPLFSLWPHRGSMTPLYYT